MMNARDLARPAAGRLLAILACVALYATAEGQHVQATPVLNEYFKMVFAGDVSAADALFADSPEDHGSQMLAARFKGRFVEKSDGLDLSGIDSPVVKSIAG